MIDIQNPLVMRHQPGNPNTINSDDLGAVWEDPAGNLWVGDKGLTKINLQIPYGEQGSVTKYKHSLHDSNSVRIHKANQFYPENENSFWVLDSEGIDLFHLDTHKIDHFFMNRETADNLFKTSDGTLYLGTIK
jgi:hypothetical protein